MRHTVSALVNNHSGVLMKVSGLFSRRGYNIESLAVGVTDCAEISRMTFVVAGDDTTLLQLLRQLSKLEDVIVARSLDPGEFVERQLVLIKVNATAETRGQIIQIAEIFRAKIINVSPHTMTIEATGTDEKIDGMQRLLEDFGVIEIVRTGTVALERGEKILGKAKEIQ